MATEAGEPTPRTQWRGQLWLGHDYGLIRGGVGHTAPHAHYAHQLLLAPQGPVTVSLDGVEHSGHRVFIEALREHAILDAPGMVFAVYAEPLLIDAQVLQQALQGVALEQDSLIAALDSCPRTPLQDPRIERALEALDQLLSAKVSATALAREAHVSLSQLERLFASHVGLPVRRLVLWRRLRLALALILGGHNITQAAHGAGFADSAHFSRTMKRLFGVTAGQALHGIELRLLA